MTLPLLPVPKSDFLGLDDKAHFAAAGESPLLSTQPHVFAAYAQDKANGLDGIISIYKRVEQARDDVARLLSAKRDEVSFALNVAQALSAIARTLDRKGGNVVLCQWEFTSTLSPWVTGTTLDVRLHREANLYLNVQQLSHLVDGETRAIIVSLVSYYTGQRVDLEELRQVADQVGAALVIDASHALGVVEFDAELADFVVSCAYKWMLGAHGAAVAYCNATRQPKWLPMESGWRSIEEVDAVERGSSVIRHHDGTRFELGNPAILSVLFTGEGARYLNRIGIPAIERYVAELTAVLTEHIHKLGLPLLTPRTPSERGGIVSFRVSDSKAWKRKLEGLGILAWVTEGRVRLSPHLYTSMSDVDRVLDAVSVLTH